MKISDLFPEVKSEDLNYEYKAILNPENPIKWAKTIVGFANGQGGTLFVGVSDDGEAFGINIDEIDKTKILITKVNDRHIFPHVRIKYAIRSVDLNAERFVLAVSVSPADSVVRYKEGDFNETVYIKTDGSSLPATPEDIISLSKRKYGVDNETTDVLYDEKKWRDYLELCKEYRDEPSIPSIKELQNEEIISKDGYVKSGFIMFKDDYEYDDSLICCRLWKGKNKTGTVLDSSRYKGSLANVFKNALNFIERNTRSGWRKNEFGGREEIRAYPKEAIREALVNAIAHRDYSIAGTQIDVDIYSDRIDIISPGSWLLPKPYEQYPVGSIPSIRRNSIIAACLDIANLMERGGTGFQTMVESYKDYDESLQPIVLIYPGFLNLRLFDCLYEDDTTYKINEEISYSQKIVNLLKEEGPKYVKDLQSTTCYKSRSQFLSEIINPLMDEGILYRDGNIKSPRALIKLKD